MELEGIDVFSGKAIRIQVTRGIVTDVNSLGDERHLPYLAPGFFDIQVNGYRGNDYNAADLSPEQIQSIVSYLDAAGVTRHFPTIITGPHERILQNLSIVAEAVSASEELRLAIPGIHLEGPYISSEDGPRGAHDPEFVRDPDWEEFSIWQEASRGMIRLITLAPERPGAQEFVRRASASGVKVALGHTAVDAMTIEAAVRSGASLSTHLGNGSHSLIPRLKNYIWEQLACDDLYASIITDGFHLPDSVIKAFWRTKCKERIILTSDVAVMGGKVPGVYRWGGIEVEVFADGHLGLAGTQYLAGAAHLLDWDIPRCVAATGCSLAEAIAACTVNPARYLDMPGSFGRVRPGSPAHLVLFHWKPGDKRLQVEQTIRAGRTVYSAAK
jgi:N-acetylglucosamine-6-phosphate deacetylase